MNASSNNKKHVLIIGSISLIILFPVIVLLAAYKLISPRYSDTMLLNVTLHQGENINEFSKKYDLKRFTMYNTENGTFYYPEKKGEDFLNYLEEIKKYPEVEDAYIHPKMIAK